MSKVILTGQLSDSGIKNCPVFVPELLTEDLIAELTVANGLSLDLEIEKFKKIEGLKVYLFKFFSGNTSLKEDVADLSIEELLLWQKAKIAKNPLIKQLSNDVKRFEKALNLIKSDETLTKESIKHCNKVLQPKNSKYGFRKKRVRVGDPDLVPYAFFSSPVHLLDFINSDKINNIDKALIAMMQLFFIHPFRDGNGRVVRALTISILEKEIGFIKASILVLYFKNINRKEYYLVQKAYRQGDSKAIANYHLLAVNWIEKTADVLNKSFEDYINCVGKGNFDKYMQYFQIVIKQSKYNLQKLDNSLFEYHSRKGSNDIYINTALLSCFNQFDYYLRCQLRSYL